MTATLQNARHVEWCWRRMHNMD